MARLVRLARQREGRDPESFGELRWQLTYKTAWYGTELVVADRWFASSKACSDCGGRHGELGRGQATWACPSCGVRHDRDVNAAINLARWPSQQLETAA